MDREARGAMVHVVTKSGTQETNTLTFILT